MSPKLNCQIVPFAEVPVDLSGEVLPRRYVILVVDDEKVIADSLSMILSMSGFATLTAYHGMDALELARVIPPDLLISDVVMPGMTGIELAIAMVDMISDCKVLLFSGQAATADLLEQARDQGRNFTVLSKPVHPTDMLQRISDCWNIQPTVAQGA